MGSYRHVVLFRFRKSADAATRAAAHDLVRAALPAPGVLSWRLAWSLDTRKGHVLLQDVAFDSATSFEAWRESPAHRNAGRVLSEIADWLVADVEE